jgi:hypothetical protein
MSATAPEKLAAEQPTQTLPVRHEYPRGLRDELWIPGTIVAAILSGEALRSYVLLSAAGRSDFAIAALLLFSALTVGALLGGRALERRDGRGRD